MRRHSTVLVRRVELSPSVVSLTLRADEPLPRAAGQYVALELEGGAEHAFSVASPFDAGSPESFEIAVARGSSAAPVLELELGDRVTVKGPGGSLVWQEDAPALLVGTGTGLSPLRALSLEQVARGLTTPLCLLFGCRDASEELWGAELRGLARTQPLFRFLPTYSRPGPGEWGRVGRVQSHLPGLVRELGPGLRAYLCGHTPMVSDCTGLLLECGVASERIHAESY